MINDLKNLRKGDKDQQFSFTFFAKYSFIVEIFLNASNCVYVHGMNGLKLPHWLLTVLTFMLLVANLANTE